MYNFVGHYRVSEIRPKIFSCLVESPGYLGKLWFLKGYGIFIQNSNPAFYVNFVSHFGGHLGSADLAKEPEIFEMFLLLFPLPQVFHLFLSG